MSKVLLDDEDFHNDAITAIIGEAEKSSTSILVTTQTLGAARAEHKYKDFDLETIELDQRLYSVLQQCIKGSRAAILEQVICPSYVQAVIVFHQHLTWRRRASLSSVPREGVWLVFRPLGLEQPESCWTGTGWYTA